MSVQSLLEEKRGIEQEVKSLNRQIKILKERKKIIEAEIMEFLYKKELAGVKHQGQAIILETKIMRKRKKVKEAEKDSISILKSHGIQNPEKVLMEILNSI